MSLAAQAAPAPLAADADDARLMSATIDLGSRELGQTWPNPAVGALVVRESESGPIVIARGFTAAGGRPHAETQALAAAGAAARGATLYVSLEPCSHTGRTPPCADAVVAAGIARVVSALEDPDARVSGRGHGRMRAAGIEVLVGVGAAQARRAHIGHITRVQQGRPHVTLKLAVSADGKVGLSGRRPARITGEDAGRAVHLMRARSDAILVGVGTVLADDPQLTCRLPGMEQRSPVRVVLDSALRTPLDALVVAGARDVPTWIITGEGGGHDHEIALRSAGVEVMRVGRGADGRLDPGEALRLLAVRGITRVLAEGGPILSQALIETDLADDVALFESPVRLGADALPVAPHALQASLARHGFRLAEDHMVGADRFTLHTRS